MQMVDGSTVEFRDGTAIQLSQALEQLVARR